jgi:thiamine-phosphate pyrophosphorylase
MGCALPGGCGTAPVGFRFGCCPRATLGPVLLYYITHRRQFAGDAGRQRELLLAKIAEAARCGVNYIQLREKDLPSHELEALAQEAVTVVRHFGKAETRLLINSRTDIALAAGADGVHLTSSDIAPSDARAIWAKAVGDASTARAGNLETRNPVIAVSCHTPAEVRMAEAHGADFAVFAPVFEKIAAPARPGAGLEMLRQACRTVAGAPKVVEGAGASRMPVLALGGVTSENARACREAGAAGIAGIRLFQENDVAQLVEALRKL